MSIRITGEPYKYKANTVSTVKNENGKGTEATATKVSATRDSFTLSAEAQAFIEQKKPVSETNLDFTVVNAGQTTFTSQVSELSKVTNEIKDAIKAYYAPKIRENLSFASPERHLIDKYKNAASPYFRSDMSAEERDLAYRQELELMRYGDISTMNDPYALEGTGIVNNIVMIGMEATNRVRNQIGSSIHELLELNGITLPEGQSFQLDVSSYDFHISVHGLDDKELTAHIEAVLNQGDNGMHLYTHLLSSDVSVFGLESAEQYQMIDQEKVSLYAMTEDLTGLDIRTLERDGRDFFTPDGQKLWDVLVDKAALLGNSDGSMGYDVSGYLNIYRLMAQIGWEGSSDSLGILYQNGSLFDTGTEYGYGPGQTDWQNWVKENLAAVTAFRMGQIDRQAFELQVQRKDDE